MIINYVCYILICMSYVCVRARACVYVFLRACLIVFSAMCGSVL